MVITHQTLNTLSGCKTYHFVSQWVAFEYVAYLTNHASFGIIWRTVKCISYMMTSSNPHYWPFLRGIHRSPVNSLTKGQWRRAFMFSLICALTKRLSKQSWGWWFETPLPSLWRHCNANYRIVSRLRLVNNRLSGRATLVLEFRFASPVECNAISPLLGTKIS